LYIDFVFLFLFLPPLVPWVLTAVGGGVGGGGVGSVGGGGVGGGGVGSGGALGPQTKSKK
jgi:hypothetical protein